MELSVPYEIKRIRARYELPDGTPYDNPIAGIHHRDETLEGLADLQFLFNRRLSSLLPDGHRLDAGFGFTIPTGRIEENPYRLADQRIKHQHIQFGTGTVDPIVRLGYSFDAPRWGFDAALQGRFPLYENRKGYKGPEETAFTIGPRLKLHEHIQAGLHYTALYQDPASWDSATDPNSGFFMQGVQALLPIQLSKDVVITPNATYVYDVKTRGDDNIYGVDWIFGLSISRSF